MKSIFSVLLLGLLVCGFGFCRSGLDVQAELPSTARALPPGPLGETIRLGQELVERTTTHPLTKPYAGNALNCTSCHLKNGTDPKAATFLGVAAAYPAWSPREQRVITLEDRILNCFMRSGNGVRPPLGSKVSVAITAYITWLSADQPIRMNAERPAGPNAVPQLKLNVAKSDTQQGATLFAERCVTCHGKNGQGDDDNPPVWDARSFNDGAGLANIVQLASWLKVAMPLNDANLTEQMWPPSSTRTNVPSFGWKNTCCQHLNWANTTRRSAEEVNDSAHTDECLDLAETSSTPLPFLPPEPALAGNPQPMQV